MVLHVRGLGMGFMTSSPNRKLRRELSECAAWLNKRCCRRKVATKEAVEGVGGAVSTSVDRSRGEGNMVSGLYVAVR